VRGNIRLGEEGGLGPPICYALAAYTYL